MRKRILLFFAAFLVWSLLNWRPDWEHLLVGFFVAGFVSYMTGDLFVYNEMLFKSPRRALYFIFLYIPVFIVSMFKASLSVIYYVVHPSLPIKPGIIKVKTSLKSDTAITFLANTITLASLAMTVDVDRDQGVLYIHCIDVKAQDMESATKMFVERFENILKKTLE